MDATRKLILAKNLRRLIRRPWGAFAQRLGINEKNFYSYLRIKDPKSPPSPVLAAIARELNISMDDLLDEPPAAGMQRIPVLGRTAAGPLAPDGSAPAPQRVSLEISGLRVTVIVEPMNRGTPKG